MAHIGSEREAKRMAVGLADSFTQCMAAPVTDHAGRVVATICFMVPRDIAPKESRRLLSRLIASGRALSVFGEQAPPTSVERTLRPQEAKA